MIPVINKVLTSTWVSRITKSAWRLSHNKKHNIIQAFVQGGTEPGELKHLAHDMYNCLLNYDADINAVDSFYTWKQSGQNFRLNLLKMEQSQSLHIWSILFRWMPP